MTKWYNPLKLWDVRTIGLCEDLIYATLPKSQLPVLPNPFPPKSWKIIPGISEFSVIL